MKGKGNQNLKITEAEEVIRQRIFIIRGSKVMLGQDLAELYQVSVKVLVQAMKRNKERFPQDFVFQLTKIEFEILKSQFVTSRWGGLRRAYPYAFTEHGIAMLSSVLRSSTAIQMNIFIVRAFIKMRESLDGYRDLAIKIGKIELRQKEESDVLYEVYTIVKQLTDTPIKSTGKIGFNESP